MTPDITLDDVTVRGTLVYVAPHANKFYSPGEARALAQRLVAAADAVQAADLGAAPSPSSPTGADPDRSGHAFREGDQPAPGSPPVPGMKKPRK